MIQKIKMLVKKIIFPNTYSSDAYIKYLKRCGIKIGDNCYVWSPNHTFIDVQRPETLIIGNNCKITQGVTILSHDYSISVAKQKYGEHIGTADVTTIGDNVFIGINTIILMGSKIGNNCIIGAGSVVCGSFPDDSVIAGNPAKVVSTLEDYYEKHKKKAYMKAKVYFNCFRKQHNRIPTIEEMGNAFAWLYLPRTKETLETYDSFFRLSGDNYEKTVQDFMSSAGMFENYEQFCGSIYKNVEDEVTEK